MPRRYLQLFSREAVYSHVRLSRDLGPARFSAWLERKDAEWELTVITHDQPFLFSNFSGVLSSTGWTFCAGYAFTKPDGLIVDTFRFSDLERFLELNPGGEAQIIRKLEEVVAGAVDVAARLRAARRARSRAGCPVCPGHPL